MYFMLCKCNSLHTHEFVCIYAKNSSFANNASSSIKVLAQPHYVENKPPYLLSQQHVFVL